jgi:hypothetical protein
VDLDDEGGTSDLSTNAGDLEDNRNNNSGNNRSLKISTIDETEAFQVMPLKEEPIDSDPSS